MANFNMTLVRDGVYADDKTTINALKKSANFPTGGGSFYKVENKNGAGSALALAQAYTGYYYIIPTEEAITSSAVNQNFDFNDITGKSGIKVYNGGYADLYCIDDGSSSIQLWAVTLRTSGEETTNLSSILSQTPEIEIQEGKVTDGSLTYYDGEGNQQTTNITYTVKVLGSGSVVITFDFTSVKKIPTTSTAGRYIFGCHIKKKTGYSLDDDNGPVFLAQNG